MDNSFSGSMALSLESGGAMMGHALLIQGEEDGLEDLL